MAQHLIKLVNQMINKHWIAKSLRLNSYQKYHTKVVHTIEECTRECQSFRRSSNTSTIGFVPTMGALHQGHLSLIRRAKQQNQFVVASIFVNPTQFGPNEDFEKYPRVLENDIQLLGQENVDLLFNPTVGEMYPKDFSTYVNVEKDSHEAKRRPNFFRGVCTVVTKLFNIVQPNNAYFGAKDALQCMVVKKMVKDLNMSVNVVICDTLREPNGLAMSSRNRYLSNKERKASSILYKSLMDAKTLFDHNPEAVTKLQIKNITSKVLLREPMLSEIQYISVVNPDTLQEVEDAQNISSGYVLSIAVIIGNVRLIDTITF